MNKDNGIKLQENLNRLIQDRNLSVSTVARKLGINKSSLHNYCNGVNPRGLVSLVKLANYFDVTLSALVLEKVDPEVLELGQGIEGKFEVVIRRVSQSSSVK